ncbi:hypothetical protein FQR65_LT19049 [Abscondita terminalis]|nr:hypothetical protein FQR65_LT19049 [Abscondita terminalis]
MVNRYQREEPPSASSSDYDVELDAPITGFEELDRNATINDYVLVKFAGKKSAEKRKAKANSIKRNLMKQETSHQREEPPSASSSDYDVELDAPITGFEELDRNATINDYVLVKFAGKKSIRYFVGKILSEISDDSEYDISYMRRRNKSNKFCYPTVPEVASVMSQDIVMILPVPTLFGKTKRQNQCVQFEREEPPSASSSDYDVELDAPITGFEELDRNATINDYVLVKFAGKKSIRYFVGKILSEISDDSEYDISYMRRRNKSNKFCYPTVPEVASVMSQDIVMILPVPTLFGKTKRQNQCVQFEVNLGQLDVQ